jgi:EAL domain-containing protein (putative c-di-GMP-specific phosphodiesterase class I)/CheY-like chemotaxis protein
MNISELNLLVVEDDDFQRRTLVNMLRSLGPASVAHAGNGKEALDIIRAAPVQPVHVAICDLNMPEMDGMEFLRHLGEESRNIAVIITSALDDKLLSSVGRMARMLGIDLLGAVEKPVTLPGLKELLARYDWAAAAPAEIKADRKFALDEILHGVRADQIVPFFQPKVSLKNGRLTGAEALARWRHPEHGVIGPDAFIPLLEQSGNIDDLTFAMLDKSAAACRSFHDKGHLITVSVNLSLASLNTPGLAEKINATIRRHGVAPQYLVLEITESAAMTDVAHALENLARLCMNGFALSIDDYGTGYSSLQQLTRIAFSELKIDQSFVKDFSDNKALRIVVESSIDMAHKLGVKSVAEGAETREDLDALRSLGCDTAQGYFVGAPMEMKAFHAYMDGYAEKAATLFPPEEEGYGKLRVLVVDDNGFTLDMVSRVLKGLGFGSINKANSAESALELFEDNTFDLVITDVNMPGMNGMEFIRLIRSGKTHARADTRIVALTSFSHTEVLGTALALDVNGFLVKPVVPAVVDEKLAQAITEPLRLRPPLAYEMIRTELASLEVKDKPKLGEASEGQKSAVNAREAPAREASRHTIRSLRPGMRLMEDVHFADGSLLMSAGHVFSQISINRLNDLRGLLPRDTLAVAEA